MSSVPMLPDRQRPLLFAHRGCSSLAPENTMAAFKKARDLGCPGIELDVHLCASGELVVVHDDTFARTAGNPAIIEALSLAEIRRLDAGSFFDPRFKDERIPLLEEVMEEFLPDMYIDIEMKGGKATHSPLPGILADTIRAFGDRAEKNIGVSSFNPLILRDFEKRMPRIPTAIIWSADKEVPLMLRRGFGRRITRSDYCKPKYTGLNRRNTHILRELEKRPIVPWTVDDPETARTLLESGCEGIITNRPQDMLFLLKT